MTTKKGQNILYITLVKSFLCPSNITFSVVDTVSEGN